MPLSITSAAYATRFRWMWGTIPLPVGHDSGNWGTIPLEPK